MTSCYVLLTPYYLLLTTYYLLLIDTYNLQLTTYDFLLLLLLLLYTYYVLLTPSCVRALRSVSTGNCDASSAVPLGWPTSFGFTSFSFASSAWREANKHMANRGVPAYSADQQSNLNLPGQLC